MSCCLVNYNLLCLFVCEWENTLCIFNRKFGLLATLLMFWFGGNLENGENENRIISGPFGAIFVKSNIFYVDHCPYTIFLIFCLNYKRIP
jgi:hypothetical protein